MINKLYYFAFQKLIVYTVFVIMAIQIIYFYSNFGYVHLILYILFLITIDVYKPEYRNVKNEIITTILYLFATFVLMISDFIGIFSGYIYHPILIFLSLVNMKQIWQFKTVFKNKELEKINERNINMFKRKDKFLAYFSYFILLLLIGIIGQAIYTIIII